MIDISVIIPVYNVEKYLPRCLDSVIAQSDCVKEIILVNDGSTDGSPLICEEYAKKDKRIKIINQENMGLSATVRVGIKAASCEYVGFVDSDDYIETDMFSILADNIQKANADVGICDYDLVYDTQQEVKKQEADASYEVSTYEKTNGAFELPLLPLLEDFTNISGSRWNKVIRRSLIVDNIGYEDHNVRIGEDIALTIPVMFASEKVIYVKRNLYHYYQRGESMVYSYRRENLDDWIKIKDILTRASIEYNYPLTDSNLAALLYSVCLSKIRKSKLTFKQRKKEIKIIGEANEVRDLLKKLDIRQKSMFVTIIKLLKNRRYGILSFIIKVGAR